MNYQKVYTQIIERAVNETRKRIKGGVYYERHHIIPKCIDISLSKEPTNLVLLTAREHFLCHWLLVRMYPDNKKLIYAWWRMCCTNTKSKKSCIGVDVQGSIYTPNSRAFEECRILNSKARSEAYSGIIKGPRSEETKQKCREKMIGRATSIKKGDKRPNLHNEHSRQLLRDANLGKRQTQETKNKKSEKMKGKTPWNKGVSGYKKKKKSYE